MEDLWFVLWFFLPAGVANVTPILAAKMSLLKHWNYPLDGYATLGGKRILGDHKTWRGLVTGVGAAVLTGFVMSLFSSYPEGSPYTLTFWLGVCFLMGFGALLGDAVKSFVKRRVGISSGRSFYVFDQIDYVLGAAILTFPFVPLALYLELLAILVWGGLSLVMSYIGYLLKFKEEPI